MHVKVGMVVNININNMYICIFIVEKVYIKSKMIMKLEKYISWYLVFIISYCVKKSIIHFLSNKIK